MTKMTIAIAALVALIAGAAACLNSHPPVAGVREDVDAADPPDAGASDAPTSDAPASDAPKVVGSVPSTAVF